MKRKRTKRASQPKTIRLDADASRVVETITSRTAWTSNLVVNRLIVAGWNAMNNRIDGGLLLKDRIDAAASLVALRAKNAEAEAKLRKRENSIAAKIRPPHLAELTEPKPSAAAAK